MRMMRDHGKWRLGVVLVCLGCWGYEAAEAQLFHDDFHRPDSETIGKGWTAHRFPGRDSGLVVAGNRLTTTDSGAGGAVNYEGHPAYDYAFGIGTNVYAAADGIVDRAAEVPEEGDIQGRHVRISHFGGYQTRYLHLDTVRVKARERVYIGQVIGTSGNSGDVAAHLHFEVRKDGAPVDPYGWSGAGPDPYFVNTGIRNVDLWRGVPALGLVSCVLEPESGAERTVRLTWLTAWGDFELESAPHLEGDIQWQHFQSTPVIDDGVARIFLPLTEAARFFRLRPR